MDEAELLSSLSDLAGCAGIEVRSVDDTSAGELPPSSGVCRVQGAVWVLLARADPLDRRTEVLALALREHAAEWMEAHFIAPALREVIDAAGEFRQSDQGSV
ncbi:MAG: hypothetical protein GY725_14990 [bacterium]|nr:hypothetical protein [bacterium]